MRVQHYFLCLSCHRHFPIRRNLTNHHARFFKNIHVLFTLAVNCENKKYDDNLYFFRSVIYARELAKLPKNFKPRYIKAADVKALYAELCMRICGLPVNAKDFCGFDLVQLKQRMSAFENKWLYI